jgi:isoleucyl-tRNA synthetase
MLEEAEGDFGKVRKIRIKSVLIRLCMNISKLTAPYIPFISEEIYKNLTGSLSKGFESVHLEDYPAADKSLIDEDLSFKMEVARGVVSLGRSVRSKISIKTRQPLTSVKIFFNKDKKKVDACKHFEGIILDELNVKKVELVDSLEDLVSYDIKPDLKIIGSKYGKLVPKIKEALKLKDPSKIMSKVKGSKDVRLNIAGKIIDLKPNEILMEIKNRENLGVESDGEYTVGITTIISENLLEEGFCRELIHKIQNLRKEAGFEIENTINTFIICSENERKVIKKYLDYIKKETLSISLNFELKDSCFTKDISVNKSKIKIGIKVIGSIV